MKVFFPIYFERGRRFFFFFFKYCWFWSSGHSAPGFVNDVFRYKIQTMLSLDTITHLRKLKKQERSNEAASHQSRRGFCLLFAVFLFFFFHFVIYGWHWMRICLQETVKHSHIFSHGALLPSQVSLHQLHDFFSTFWFLFFSSNPLFFI